MRKKSAIPSIKIQLKQCSIGPFKQHWLINNFLKSAYVLLFISFLTAGPISATGQRSTPDTLIRKVQLPDSVIEKKLVELALTGPAYEESKHQNKINEYQLKSAKNSWLNLLTISASYNDQTFKNNTSQNTYIYPKYFTSINLPLGTLFSRTGVKAAREGLEISKNKQEQLSRNIKVDVLSKYRQYKDFIELIAYQKELVDDYEAIYLRVKNEFKEGTISIETHNTASKNYNDVLTTILNLQYQQYIVKLEIERIIGTKLESVMFDKKSN
jgi:outer membrane protein TolC